MGTFARPTKNIDDNRASLGSTRQGVEPHPLSVAAAACARAAACNHEDAWWWQSEGGPGGQDHPQAPGEVLGMHGLVPAAPVQMDAAHLGPAAASAHKYFINLPIAAILEGSGLGKDKASMATTHFGSRVDRGQHQECHRVQSQDAARCGVVRQEHSQRIPQWRRAHNTIWHGCGAARHVDPRPVAGHGP